MAYAAHWDQPAAGERRVGERRTLRLEAEGVTANGERAEVLVHNISEGGLLVETATPLTPGEELDIVLPHAGATRAAVRWTSGRLSGCAFAEPVSAATLSAAQLRSVPDPAAAPSGLPDPGFPSRLQRLRKGRGLTLAQIANMLQVSKPTVWAWEQGRSRPVESRVDALAEALGVSRAELFPDHAEGGAVDALVARAREDIAAAAGTSPDRVRIMIEL